jgi:hypothetical protein
MSAFGFVAVLMLPGMLVSTAALLCCCREALALSSSFFRAMRPDKPAKEFYPLRLYLARYISCAVVTGFSALLEAFLYFMFANSLLIG